MSKNSGLNFPGIYTITRVASGSVYVGQASNIRIRWQHHNRDLRKNRHRNFVLQRAWNKHGSEAFVFAVVKDLTDVPLADLAAALNAAEIEALLSSPRAYNLMVAGESGTLASKETKALLSKIQTASWADPKRHRKQSALMRAMYAANPAWKAARDAAVKESRSTDKARAATSAQAIALWESDEHRAEQSAKRSANWQDPTYRQQQSDSRKASWANPESRARRIEGLKAAAARPEVLAARKAGQKAALAKMGASQKVNWQDPEYRKRQSASRSIGTTARYTDPAQRELTRQKMKEVWARRKAAKLAAAPD